ncbi:uncharacterized protein LOC135209540 [Macrobrachium nipponense]|uniref:uncharacterized protein LOC135209540 n=1 Tax=Macrobrachium nipponense TaxID=159736 RepID=UPI0030C810F3
MEWRFIIVICCLLFHASLSSAHSASETRTTSRGNSTKYTLPEEENVVVAILKERAPIWAYLNYRFSVHGREIHARELDYTYPPSQWKPLLFISKEDIRSPYLPQFWIPTENVELKGRQVEVSSSHPVKWQVLSLPLNDYDMIEISPDQESPLNLPGHNPVWIALWNKNKFDIVVRFSLIYEYPRKTKIHHLTVNEGWLITSISIDAVLYGNGWYNWWANHLQVRELRIWTDSHLQLQVFPMPLEPQGTSTGSSPVKPEDSPTGIPVSTQIIIGVVVAVLVVVAASFLCYRCCFRKQNDTRAEDTTLTAMNNINPTFSNNGGPTDFDLRNHGTVPHPDLPRPSSSHDSENSIYGVIVPH